MFECVAHTCMQERARTFPFWITDQYCSSVNIISFVRLIRLKRDELKTKKGKSRQKPTKNRPLVHSFTLFTPGAHKRRRRFLYNRSQCVLMAVSPFPILFDPIYAQLICRFCFAD